MKPEKTREPDALEKELRQLIRKLDSENDALNKILKHRESEKETIKPKTSSL